MRQANAGVFRYEPRTQKFEVYVSYGFANPHGHVFDRWGQDIVIDGTGGQPVPRAVVLRPRRLPGEARPGRRRSSQQRTRPCRRHRDPLQPPLPRRDAGQPARAERDRLPGHPAVQARRGRRRLRRCTEVEPILASTDANFRPVDVEIGADGALYFIDWQNPIIGHMQHNLRDPSRDHDARPRLPRHLRGPAAARSRRRSPASRSSSCSTCSRSRRTASATAPRSS